MGEGMHLGSSQGHKDKCVCLLPGCSARCDTAAQVYIAPAPVPGSQTALLRPQRWLQEHRLFYPPWVKSGHRGAHIEAFCLSFILCGEARPLVLHLTNSSV